MSYFLLVYDRETGVVRELTEFPDAERDQALRARFARELQERDHENIEVVVLGAESLSALVHTHSRYFKSIREQLAPS